MSPDPEQAGGEPERRPGRRRRSASRRLARFVVGLLVAWLVALLALLGGVYALANGWQPERMRQLIEAGASELLHHRVRIGVLRGSLLSGLRLEDISVSPDSEPEVGAAGSLSARVVEVELDLAASLRAERLVIGRLALEGVFVDLARSREGVWTLRGWGDLKRGARGAGIRRPSRQTLQVDVLDLRDIAATLEIADEKRERSAQLAVDASLAGFSWRLDRTPAWPAHSNGRLQIDSASWNDLRLAASSVRFETTGRRIRLSELQLASPIARIEGEAGLLFTGPLRRPRLASSDLSLHFEAFDLAALPLPEATRAALASEIAGDATAQLRRRGDHHELALALTLAPGSQLAGGELTSGSVRGRIDVPSGAWKLEEASLGIAAGVVSARGSGDREALEQLEVEARGLALSELPAPWLPARHTLAGRARLGLQLAGRYADPTGELDLSGEGLQLDRFGPFRGELRLASLGARRFRIDALSLETERDAWPKAGLRVNSSHAASFEWSGNALHVEDLGLDWNAGALALSGGLQDGQLLPTRVELRSLDLATAAGFFTEGELVSGELAGVLELEGAARDPRIAGRLTWRQPRVRGVEAELIEIDLDSEPRQIAIDASLQRDGRAALALHARLPRPLPLSEPQRWLHDPASLVEIEAKGFELGWISPFVGNLPALRPSVTAGEERKDAELRGRIDGALRARGGLPRPQISGQLQIEAATLDLYRPGTTASRYGPLTGAVELTGHSLRSEGLEIGEGPLGIRVAGGVQWSESQDLRLAFELSADGLENSARLELQGGIEGDTLMPTRLRLTEANASWIAGLAGRPLDLGGSLAADIVARGPLAGPELEGHAVWQDPRIGAITAERMELTAHLHSDGLTAEGALTRAGQRSLSTRIALGLQRSASLSEQIDQLRHFVTRPDTRIEIEADDFDLDWIALLLPRLPVQTRGRANGVLRLAGGEPQPSLDGSLDIEAGTFSISGQRATAGPLHGRLRFEGSQIVVERLVLDSGPGEASVSGGLAWSPAGFGDVDLALRLDDFGFDQLGVVRSVLNGELKAQGHIEALDVTGRVALSNVRVSFPSAEDPVLKEIRVLNLPAGRGGASIEEGGAQIAGIGAQSRLDIVISLPAGTWVRGMGLDAEVVGEVTVTKPPGEPPSYAGVLEVTNGRYTLQGKRFELERSVAMFAGVDEPIPDLDIRAVRQVSREVRVTAHVRGPANAPTLELTSEPPMDTAEIISFVYFGRSRNEAATAQENSDLSSALMAAFGTSVFNNLAPELVEYLPIDQVTVTSGDDGPAVEIESQVTPDIYLRLSQSLGTAADESIEVRYRLLWGFALKSLVNRTGASSLDLIWTYEFWGLDDYGAGGLRAPPPPPPRPPLAAPVPEPAAD